MEITIWFLQSGCYNDMFYNSSLEQIAGSHNILSGKK